VNYTDSGVIITNSDGSCISADYAICTFSLGVLQAGLVSFSPSLPEWKTDGIASMQMGTYTKIFLQFPPDKVFWDTATQFFLYADPFERGYYPVWQSLDHADFLPGSGILFATVVQDQSFRAEKQTDEQTKAQVMAVLRSMYPGIEVPEPVAFMYPRWSEVPWAMGSYSNMPPGTSLLMHQNLRANLGRLWFAGEATSAAYFGFLQGETTLPSFLAM
jgi:polyamine oxidase